jgi:hypothetical protein
MAYETDARAPFRGQGREWEGRIECRSLLIAPPPRTPRTLKGAYTHPQSSTVNYTLKRALVPFSGQGRGREDREELAVSKKKAKVTSHKFIKCRLLTVNFFDSLVCNLFHANLPAVTEACATPACRNTSPRDGRQGRKDAKLYDHDFPSAFLLLLNKKYLIPASVPHWYLATNTPNMPAPPCSQMLTRRFGAKAIRPSRFIDTPPNS